MKRSRSAVPTGPRGWRRKWKRTPAERRSHAAGTLGDLFAARPVRALLPLMVLVSLVLHGLTAPFLVMGKTTDRQRLEAQQNTYLQKVMQKQRAKEVSKGVKDRITMPLTPPDPEEVVETAMSESLTDDVAKITGDLLSVELQEELAAYVRTSLADELAAAAKDIATGRLTEEEIKQLHQKFQSMAHDMTVAWRKEYLIEHQEERAAMSTTEWYEKEVARTLCPNIYFQLFTPPGYTRHPPSPNLWRRVYCGGYGWVDYTRWGDMRSVKYLRDKLRRVEALVGGKWHNAGGRGVDQHPGWPGPGLVQAETIAKELRRLYEGRATRRYPHPSWEMSVHGAKGRPKMTFGVLREYEPHCKEQMRPKWEKVGALWSEALSASEAYLALAREPVAGEQLKAAREACLRPMREISKTARPLLPANAAQRAHVRWVVGNDVVRKHHKRMYKKWVDGLVAGLSPLIRDFAKGQFKKGIIVHKDGVDQAMKDFPKTVIPLVRRDVERMFNHKHFFKAVYQPFLTGRYVSKVTGSRRPPTDAEVDADLKAAAATVAKWPEQDRPYLDACRAELLSQFRDAITNMSEAVLDVVLTGSLLVRQMNVYVEGVDYADGVQEKLTARAMAMKGRGQDLAKLTRDGVPDTSAPLVALIFGASKGHGANLEPVTTLMQPAMVTGFGPFEVAVLPSQPVLPRRPAKWGFEEQATVSPKFRSATPRFEGIPFLTKFPRLDGDLSDWGTIRPLVLRPRRGTGEPILVYAAWNYQGFFFGYRVRQDAEEFYYPSLWQKWANHNTGSIGYRRVTGVGWAQRGDYLRLVFDTLDARNANRGEPHTQEFVLFPRGTESGPNVPGIERLVRSQRDAQVKDYRGVKASCRIFPQQPPPESGPDGSGPYRATRSTKDGYTMEVFIPRSILNVPVFAPGWYVGFDCAVAMGVQPRRGFRGQDWAGGSPDRPYRWGDLLLLGTDPRIVVQEANRTGNVVYNITPGHSYLLTVIDPDRNVNPATKDTVLVSAEVGGGGGAERARTNDVEVYILKESGENTGVFRGYVNTQPGPGRQVQGVLEVMPLQEVRFGYVDFANSKGKRNVINEMTLPVVAPVTFVAMQGP